MGNNGGVSNIRAEGLGETQRVSEISITDSTFNSVTIGDYASFVT